MPLQVPGPPGLQDILGSPHFEPSVKRELGRLEERYDFRHMEPELGGLEGAEAEGGSHKQQPLLCLNVEACLWQLAVLT